MNLEEITIGASIEGVDEHGPMVWNQQFVVAFHPAIFEQT